MALTPNQEALKQKLQADDYEWNETRRKLRDFASLARVRPDWHEPDEQEVTAVVKGRQLDNACGDGALADPKPIEKVVELKIDGEAICRINLATLLALAANPDLEQ